MNSRLFQGAQIYTSGRIEDPTGPMFGAITTVGGRSGYKLEKVVCFLLMCCG